MFQKYIAIYHYLGTRVPQTRVSNGTQVPLELVIVVVVRTCVFHMLRTYVMILYNWLIL